MSGGDYMFELKKCISIIETMPKEQFHETIVRSVAATNEFSRLATIGAGSLSENEKAHICRLLQSAAVPVEYSVEADFDQGLQDVAITIMARAVQVI